MVNGIIRKYGKPVRIRIELARDIRNTRKQRQDSTKKIKDRTDERDGFKREMASKLPDLFGGRDPFKSDVEKWALADECNWVCPYTVRGILRHPAMGRDNRACKTLSGFGRARKVAALRG